MKILFNVFLIMSVMNCYLGCNTTTTMVRTVDDLDEDDEVPLRFVTKDNTYYVLEAGTYSVHGDSLTGRGWKNQKGAYLRTGENNWHKIALNDIKQIKAEDTTVIDAGLTAPIIAVAAIFVGGLIVLFILFATAEK